MKNALFLPARLCLAAAFLGGGLLPILPSSARAQDTLVQSDVYTFDGVNGSGPGSLVQGDDGNLYGVTGSGGFGYVPGTAGSGNGTVFRLAPTGELTTIYVFSGNDDGKTPYALGKGRDGNFYGATISGGDKGGGTVFKITPAGELTTIYSSAFLGLTGPLVQDDDGNLYGVSTIGGPETANYGSLFRLTQAGVYTTLHVFTGDDGAAAGGMTRGSDGNFYGVGNLGGDDGGIVYRLTPAGNYTDLYNFTGKADGFLPNDVTLASDGNLYGTTLSGGANGYGVVFQVTNAGQIKVIYNFTGGSDSEYPTGKLVAGSDGNLYGITYGDTIPKYVADPIIIGGPITPAPPAPTGPPSTLFRITLSGDLTTLYASDATVTPFIQGSDGNFYDTEQTYTTGDNGSVDKLTDVPHSAFFAGRVLLTQGVEYLAFPNGDYFGYYVFLHDPNALYHFDLGYEYLFDANDGDGGLYLYDFVSRDFFYTSRTYAFPYLYDFGLKAVLYYFPDPNNAGRYNTNGVRYFYNFSTGKIISK